MKKIIFCLGFSQAKLYDHMTSKFTQEMCTKKTAVEQG